MMTYALILHVHTCFTVSIFNRIFFTFATSVGLSSELSSLERIVSRQWLNILLNPYTPGSDLTFLFCHSIIDANHSGIDHGQETGNFAGI